jgi:cell division protein FtsB
MTGTDSTDAPRAAPLAAEAGASGRSRAHLTSRAAILAVVVCAIALSLAYPIREYIAQRREIAALREQQQTAQRQVEQLARHKQRLGDESYIKREARRRLHYCMPGEKCYVVLGGSNPGGQAARQGRPPRTPPWYVTLWRSVEAADEGR